MISKRVVNFLFLSFSASILLITLLQSSCKDADYMSREEFFSYMTGNWYVSRFSHYGHPVNLGNNITILVEDNGFTYEDEYAGTSIFYSFDDTIPCTLEDIEYLQYWTISEKNNKLTLVTNDLCGDTNVYTIEYKNYQYASCSENDLGQIIECHDLYADLTLVNENDTIVLQEFWFYTEDLWMKFLVPDDSEDTRHKKFYIGKIVK
jgi:hypothetical protein